jgi:hypothetical protein
LILDNPFRKLGLPATASGREVRRRFDELSVKAALGVSPNDLRPEELSRVRQELEDPVQRARQEVFWLHAPAERIDPALDVTAASAVEPAIAVLREAAGRPPSAEQAIALHDLAVLSYARYLTGENGADPGDAVSLWAEVVASEEFWRHLQERAAEAGDPRLTGSVIDQIRAEVPDTILQPVGQRAAGLIDDGDLEAAAELLRALRRSGLPAEAIERAVRAAIAPIRARLEDGASAVERLVESISSSEGPSPAARAKLEAAEKVLVERVLALVARLKTVDPVFNDAAIADGAAAAVRRLSVAICNVLDDWAWGYVLLREALGTAGTPSYVSQLAGEQAQVCASYHHSIATEAAAMKQPLLAAAHIELAVPYARSEDERIEWMNVALGARRQGRLADHEVDAEKSRIAAELERRQDSLRERVLAAGKRSLDVAETPDEVEATPISLQPAGRGVGRPRRRWLRARWLAGLVVVALIAVGIVLGRGSSGSSDSRNSGTPAAAQHVTPTPQPASQAAASCSDLPALSSELDNVDAQISAKRRLLKRIDAREAPIAAALQQILRDYPGQTNLPPDVWRRFAPLRRQYRALEAQSKRTARDGNALIRTYNQKVKTYNQLKRDC